MLCPQMRGQKDHGSPTEKKLKFSGIHSGHDDDMEKAEMSLLTSLFKKKSKLIRPKIWKILNTKRWKNYQMCLPLLIPDLKAPYTGSELRIAPSAVESGGNKINPQWKNTRSGKRNFGPLVFSTDKMPEALSNSKNTLCDGTFKCAPEPFQQLFTAFNVKAGRKLPLIFALVKRKTTGDYRRLCKHSKEKYFKLTGQPDWNPDFFFVWFQRGHQIGCWKWIPGNALLGVFFSLHAINIPKSANFGF